MKIASWNVNSIKARLPTVTDWLKASGVDVLLLQELKGENFPAEVFTELDYRHQVVLGQKAYNGVAILSRHEITDEVRGLPGDDQDTQARFIGGTVGGIKIHNLYLPNGNPKDTEKFPYKLGWMRRLHNYAHGQIETKQPVVFAGDYNVIPQPIDAKRPEAWKNDALFSPEARREFQRMLNMGYTDAFRALYPDVQAFTFWDYFAGSFQRNDGIRIDHFLLSPEATDMLQAVEIDRNPRGLEKASDHTPVIITLGN